MVLEKIAIRFRPGLLDLIIDAETNNIVTTSSNKFLTLGASKQMRQVDWIRVENDILASL